MVSTEKGLTTLELKVVDLHINGGLSKMKALVQVFPTYNNLSNSELQSIDSYFWSRASVKKAIREAEQKKIDNCNQAIADLKGQGGDIKYEVDDIIW